MGKMQILECGKLIKKSRLRWFGHVVRKDDNDWVKCCITWSWRN